MVRKLSFDVKVCAFKTLVFLEIVFPKRVIKILVFGIDVQNIEKKLVSTLACPCLTKSKRIHLIQ